MLAASRPAPVAAPIELGMRPVYVLESEELVDGEDEEDADELVESPESEVLALFELESLDDDDRDRDVSGIP